MKFESTAEQLHSAASLASRFTNKQANLPVLSSILIAAEGGSATLRATNLECGVEVSLSAKVSNQGSVCVPTAPLLGFLSNTHSKNVTLELQGQILKLKTDRATASIKTVPHEDFPTLPKVSAEHSFALKAQDIARGLRSTLHCAATSSVKPELQSVCIFGEAGKLYFAATDSFRLSERCVPLTSKGSIRQILLPARNAAELLRIIEGQSGDLEFYYSDNQLSVHADRVYYTSRLVDGSFPNYRQIIPKEFATEAVVLREDLSQALKSLAVFSDKFLQVSLTVDPKRKIVELSSRNQDVGEEDVTLRAAVSGEESKMNFNSRYLGDGLAPISGESVRLRLNGAGKAMVVKDAADDSFVYLAMPMNR
ncbi:MAG: DNA polymerase III subunit beta [Patescibacteria group bacterium]|nr:DNA polymerase III subunit beta [Patescibacteria group bacterium]